MIPKIKKNYIYELNLIQFELKIMDEKQSIKQVYMVNSSKHPDETDK